LSLVDLYQLCKIWCLFLMGNLVEFFITCRLWALVFKIFWSRIECYYKGGGIHNATMWHLRLHKQSHLQSFISLTTTHECVIQMTMSYLPLIIYMVLVATTICDHVFHDCSHFYHNHGRCTNHLNLILKI